MTPSAIPPFTYRASGFLAPPHGLGDAETGVRVPRLSLRQSTRGHGNPGRAEGVGPGDGVGRAGGLGVIGPRPGTPYCSSSIAPEGAGCDSETVVTPTVAAPSAMVMAATRTMSASVRCCISTPIRRDRCRPRASKNRYGPYRKHRPKPAGATVRAGAESARRAVWSRADDQTNP